MTFTILFHDSYLLNTPYDMEQLPAKTDRRPIWPGRGADWELFKEEIIQLYWVEDKSLDKVADTMKAMHYFHAIYGLPLPDTTPR
jgi:hypothetical protein